MTPRIPRPGSRFIVGVKAGGHCTTSIAAKEVAVPAALLAMAGVMLKKALLALPQQ